MKDGKIIRLLGIDYPMGSEESALAGKMRLEKLIPESTEVMLYQTRSQKTGRTNRMGHTLAHLVNKETGEWINGTMVAEGLAWAYTDKSNPDMAEPLYMLEQKARETKKGLWAKDSPFGLLASDDAMEGDGTFRVVEGAIKSAGSSKNNLYLNFGNDRTKDFTVMISASLRKALAKKGVDPMGLSGKTVRVRGWIRNWNGPFMELDTPERLEILSPLPSTGLSPQTSTEPPIISPEKAPTGQINP